MINPLLWITLAHDTPKEFKMICQHAYRLTNTLLSIIYDTTPLTERDTVIRDLLTLREQFDMLLFEFAQFIRRANLPKEEKGKSVIDDIRTIRENIHSLDEYGLGAKSKIIDYFGNVITALAFVYATLYELKYRFYNKIGHKYNINVDLDYILSRLSRLYKLARNFGIRSEYREIFDLYQNTKLLFSPNHRHDVELYTRENYPELYAFIEWYKENSIDSYELKNENHPPEIINEMTQLKKEILMKYNAYSKFSQGEISRNFFGYPQEDISELIDLIPGTVRLTSGLIVPTALPRGAPSIRLKKEKLRPTAPIVEEELTEEDLERLGIKEK